MAQSRDEELRKRRRKRLIRGLLMGGAAIGVPALINAVVSKRAKRLPAATWGQAESYRWKHGKISYQRLGEGSPILLLHTFGPGHGNEEWRRSAEILARKHEVFAPDLLGWGQSDKPALTYDGELYIALIEDLLKDVVGAPATIVASGLSAAYAVQLAVDQGELLRALALVVPSGIELHGDEPDFKDAMVHRLLRLPILGTSAMNVFTSRSAIANYLRREVYSTPSRVDANLIDRHYRSSHEPGAQASLAAFLSGYLNHGVREILNQVETPVWIGWGRHAASSPVESADLWLRDLEGADLDVFEGCGILPHTEAPGPFCQRLETFLANFES